MRIFNILIDKTGKSSTPLKQQFCRCGMNNAKAKPSKKKYFSRNRCKCILKSRTCHIGCKCDGRCGGLQCKSIVLSDSMTQKKATKRYTKVKHSLQKSKVKLLSTEKHGFQLNFMEICILCAIMQNFKSIGKDCFDTKGIYCMYTKIINSLLDLGIVLPVNLWNEKKIHNEINKLKKHFS